jgi:hypothetical protein
VEAFVKDVTELDDAAVLRIGNAWLNRHHGDRACPPPPAEWAPDPPVRASGELRSAFNEAREAIRTWRTDHAEEIEVERLVLVGARDAWRAAEITAKRRRRLFGRFTAAYRAAKAAASEAQSRLFVMSGEISRAEAGRDRRGRMLGEAAAAAANAASYAAVGLPSLDVVYGVEPDGERFGAARATGQAAVALLLSDLVAASTFRTLTEPYFPDLVPVSEATEGRLGQLHRGGPDMRHEEAR